MDTKLLDDDFDDEYEIVFKTNEFQVSVMQINSWRHVTKVDLYELDEFDEMSDVLK